MATDLREQRAPIPRLLHRSGVAGLLLFVWPLALRLVSRPRQVEEYREVDASAYAQMAFLGLCCAYLLLSFLPRRPRWRRLLGQPPVRWMAVFSALALLSAVWSPLPTYSAYRAVETFVFLLLAVQTVANLSASRQDALEYIVLWTLWAGLLRATLVTDVRYQPGFTLLQRWHGAESSICSPILIPAFLLSRRRWAVWAAFFLAAFSTSSKVYLGLAVGLMAYGVALQAPGRKVRFWLLTAGVLLLALAAGLEALTDVLFPGKSQKTILMGTGRIPIWIALATHTARTSPWIGSGFAESERVITQLLGTHVALAHNSLLAAFSAAGALGLAAMTLFFVSGLRLAWSRREDPWRAPMFAGCVMTVFIAQFAVGVGSRLSGHWVTVVLVFALIASVFGRARQAPETEAARGRPASPNPVGSQEPVRE